MKKILSLVLVLALVLSSFSFAAADPVTVGEELKALGVLTGDENGNLNPDQQLTREQALVVLARMMGKEADAKATTTASSFKDIKGTFYGPYIAYAELQGWTNGLSAGVFGFGKPATIDEIYAFMLRALGYTVATLPEAVTKAAELKLNTDVTAEAGKPVLRGQVFITMNNTLNTAPKDGKDALVYVLKLKEKPVVPVVELAVADLTALNTKQIEVKFNAEVDKTTAETASNYTVAGVPFGKAVLQADKKTVIATMATDTKVTNATEVEFKVLKNVKDAAGVALKADFAKKITVVDTVSPTFVSVKAVGQKTLELTFSEPVIDNNAAGAADDLLATQFTVKSGIYTYVVQTAKADFAGRTITLTLGTNLLAGNVDIRYNALGMGDVGAIRDFAGLAVVPATVTYAYAVDTTVATATLTSVNKATKTATVTFSKPVYGSSVKMFHSVNGTDAYGTAPVTKAEAAASTTWDFVFTNALPSGALTFFLANDSVAANQITDLFGVKVPNQTFAFTVVADTTAPTVTKYTVNTNASIDIDYSEDVDATEAAKAANFEILKPDGTALTFTAAALDANTTRLTATLVDNTTYTVTVKAMKDVAGNALAAAYTSTAVVGDNLNPTATAYSTDNKTIYVVFSEAMNAADLVNKALYLFDADGNGADTDPATAGIQAGANGGGAAVALGASDTITAVSDKKVKIVINAATVVANSDLTIGAAKDLAGKVLTADATFSTNVDVPLDTLTFTSELIAKDKLKIKFSKELGLFTAADFTLATSAFLAIESNQVVSGKTEVVLILETAQAANATPALTAADPDGAGPLTLTTKSVEGTVVTPNNPNALDKVAPTFDKVVFVNANLIEVQLTENATANSIALAGTNGFSVSGGTLTSALKGTANNVIRLVGSGFTSATDVTYTAGNIIDAALAPNAMATQSRTTTLDAAAITVVNVVADNTFTVTTNYENAAITTGDIDMDTVTAGVQDFITINNVTYTAVAAAGTVTITATGNATNTLVAGTSQFTITLSGVTKTVTMGVPATTATQAGTNPTVAGQ